MSLVDKYMVVSYSSEIAFMDELMRSPLKDNPLHNPAESLDKEIEKLVHEDATKYIIMLVFMVVLTLQEWWRWFFELKPNPIIVTAIAFIVIPYAVWKLYKFRLKLKNLRLGRDGEKAVGQHLESLRESSARVFHDIPASNFNLDHVVIAKSGIYVIETKTYSKPASGSPKIVFDGTTLRMNTGVKTDKPVIQVQAACRWLSDLLKQSTGKSFPVKSVIVFPGWFIEPTSEAKNSDVWVLNPKGLPTFISNSADRLSSDEVSMAAYHLSRYVRSYKA
ncbi:nuclease-related domain-containing protein [Methylophaga sp. OBS3]|uniref:nuclease-related domain-containing protein n=1 Tax=Methylophaga sp. OBS3 TaxID=2991934 RepID=UPI0022540A2E|nr:nuclease-related domain-containing protein [Methylophaga sp. OBS3]MCX4190829.1 NERD domain-containing protein [Methylophaga sp. OBS3]